MNQNSAERRCAVMRDAGRYARPQRTSRESAVEACGFAPADPLDLSAVVRDHFSSLLRTATSMLKDHDAAWDAAQETLIALWREPTPPPQLKAWLIRTLKNRCLMQMRSERRRRANEERAALWSVERAEHDASMDECLICRERLRDLLRQLTSEHRLVLTLRDVEGLSYEQIASRTGLPVGTVRSRISRARSTLRRHVGGDDLSVAS